MELYLINGIACVKRTVDNIEVYIKLMNNPIKGLASIIKIEDNDVYYQYINGKTLNEFSNNEINLTRFIYEMVLILDGLKNIGIVHKDIKPENIVVSNDNEFYLIDFNVSRVSTKKDSDTTLFGTRGYASPEHFGYSNTTFKSDMYSLGMLIQELDENKKYSFIVNKCTQIDPINRFDSYIDIIKLLDINEITLPKEIDKYEVNHNKIEEINKNKTNIFVNTYDYKILGIYFILFIIFLMIYFNTTSLPFYETFASFYASFFLIDVIDYIRVFIKKRWDILKYKIVLSLVVLFITTIIVGISQSSFK